jgi:hypothetical protein
MKMKLEMLNGKHDLREVELLQELANFRLALGQVAEASAIMDSADIALKGARDFPGVTEDDWLRAAIDCYRNNGNVKAQAGQVDKAMAYMEASVVALEQLTGPVNHMLGQQYFEMAMMLLQLRRQKEVCAHAICWRYRPHHVGLTGRHARSA